MKNILKQSCSTGRVGSSAFYLALAALPVSAQDLPPDKFALDLGYQRYWDSNHSRTPEPESEVIDTSRVGVKVKHGIKRQNFVAQAAASRLQHETAEYLDATLYDATVSWDGALGQSIGTLISWQRQDRLADRDEFPGRDIISLAEGRAELSYAINPRWYYVIGGRGIDKSHSNSAREIYDYEESNVETGLRFESSKGSNIALMVSSGERFYINSPVDSSDPPPAGSDDLGIFDPNDPDTAFLIANELDFEYQRVSLGGEWQVSEKTAFLGGVDYSERTGGINDGNATDATLGVQWQASPKTRVSVDYLYREPARGEDSENPAETQRVNMAFSWEMNERINFGSRISLIAQEFDATTTRETRDESKVKWQPVYLSYRIANTLRLELSGEWLQRDSPLESREYEARGVAMGVAATF